jgi:hypothetical protein
MNLQIQILTMASISRILAITAICFSLFSSPTIAHPGEHHDKLEVLKEMKERGIEAMKQQASISKCANSEESQARQERALQRRAQIVQQLREERGLLDSKSTSDWVCSCCHLTLFSTLRHST